METARNPPYAVFVEHGTAKPRPATPRWIRSVDRVATAAVRTIAYVALAGLYVLWVMSKEGWV